MTREEIENNIINTLFECTHSGEDDTISDKEFAKVLADKFINYETELLKEFVEYLKSTKKYQAIDEDTDTRGISWGKRYTFPNHQFDKDLEKFLEERK